VGKIAFDPAAAAALVTRAFLPTLRLRVCRGGFETRPHVRIKSLQLSTEP
jgi:hypothetical protein